MMKKCENCVHFVPSLYSNNPARPDSRCGHRSAQVGFNDEPPYEIQSLLTIREARLPRSSRKDFPEEVLKGMAEYDQCGPDGAYHVQRR